MSGSPLQSSKQGPTITSVTRHYNQDRNSHLELIRQQGGFELGRLGGEGHLGQLFFAHSQFLDGIASFPGLKRLTYLEKTFEGRSSVILAAPGATS